MQWDEKWPEIESDSFELQLETEIDADGWPS